MFIFSSCSFIAFSTSSAVSSLLSSSSLTVPASLSGNSLGASFEAMSLNSSMKTVVLVVQALMESICSWIFLALC